MMQADWERRPDAGGAWPEDVVRQVAAGAVRDPGEVRPLSGGLANATFRVDSPAGPVVVRGWTRDPSRADVECALLEQVASRVPVPRVLHRSTVADVPVAVLSWAPGRPLAHVASRLDPRGACEVFHDAGRVLRAIQDQGFAQVGLLDLRGGEVEVSRPFSSVVDAWREALTQALFESGAGAVLGEAWVARVWGAVATHSAVLQVREDPVLCHADFKAENLLVDCVGGTWGVSAVLDWEFAWSGPAWFDAGQMLRWEHQWPAGVADAFASGWQRFAGELPPDWRLRARLLDLMNLCAMLAGTAARPRMRADLLMLLDQTLARL